MRVLSVYRGRIVRAEYELCSTLRPFFLFLGTFGRGLCL